MRQLHHDLPATGRRGPLERVHEATSSASPSPTGEWATLGGEDGIRTREKQGGKAADLPSSAAHDGAAGDDSNPFVPVQNLSRLHLEGAIASVTRALATASGEAVVVLARERAAMRAELRELATAPTNVVPLNRRQ